MLSSGIVLNQLSFTYPGKAPLFSHVNLSLDHGLYALIGDNGVGKSTLFNLLLGKLKPVSGTIQASSLMLVPQVIVDAALKQCVSDFLEVSAYLASLDAIQDGEGRVEDFDRLEGRWDFQSTLHALFAQFGLQSSVMSMKVSQLSGGERQKLLLIKMSLSEADFLLLDEPTNHLDTQAREQFYAWLKATKKSVLVISHDRQLLALMENIVELDSRGLHCYQGNYQAYLLEKNRLAELVTHQLDVARVALKRQQASVKQSQDRKAKRAQTGKKARKTGSQAKILLDAKQNRADKTQSTLKKQGERLLAQATEAVKDKAKLVSSEQSFSYLLQSTDVASQKRLFELTDLCFRYNEQTPWLFRDFSYALKGPKRLLLRGDNGAGKSTFFKLLLGELTPVRGRVEVFTDKIAYFSQTSDPFSGNDTLKALFMRENPRASEQQAYDCLARAGFRNKAVDKEVASLSGGERMRLFFAAHLLAKKPELLLLDEPTNHLDLAQVALLEEMLHSYRGAMIVVSHDKAFTDKLLVDDELHLHLFSTKQDGSSKK